MAPYNVRNHSYPSLLPDFREMSPTHPEVRKDTVTSDKVYPYLKSGSDVSSVHFSNSTQTFLVYRTV